jgi:hypothetical protein
MSTIFLSAEETQYLTQQPRSRLAPWLRDRIGLTNLPQNVELHVSGPDPHNITQAWVSWTAPVTTYTSPDGGHTVIRHDQHGQALHWQDSQAVRRQQLAQIQSVISAADRDDMILLALTEALEPVMTLARLRNHNIL